MTTHNTAHAKRLKVYRQLVLAYRRYIEAAPRSSQREGLRLAYMQMANAYRGVYGNSAPLSQAERDRALTPNGKAGNAS